MSIKQTILVVDDEQSVRDALTLELEASYDVLVACDGIDAIRIYDRNVERVAAIVTDLNMPRLSGQLVAEWVHHIRPHLPVVIMSGSICNTELEDLLQSPTVSFLSKPFEPLELELLLSLVLEKRQDQAA
ncbi:MAG TPA: response regulator [Pyrinomonadaceae bacterium]